MEYNKQLLNKFVTEKAAVHLETKDELNSFVKLLRKEEDAKYLEEEKSILLEVWGKYKGKLCLVWHNKTTVSYSSSTYYQEQGYEIIEFKDLIKEEKI